MAIVFYLQQKYIHEKLECAIYLITVVAVLADKIKYHKLEMYLSLTANILSFRSMYNS